ncbi:hypothetical protein PR048_030266 [Dryococelus australis]|uniref:Uncharacterized protein n=1 Tax=Dryococelus australis TaxID=614101 RepID=A0ABQ9G9A2_9NEOP|nr:hypothetical protein PR048_030266 [Dryococelus australis]
MVMSLKQHSKGVHLFKNRFDLLDHCYSNFEKSKYAGLAKLLADGADQGDPLCLWLFAQTGEVLARHITALFSKVDKV